MRTMRRTSSLVFAVALTIASRSPHAAATTPILGELFTSEGCSDCPPADTVLQKLIETQPVGGAEIIGLGQHVDYWDRQGWKDRFSSAALTNRQQVYATRFRNESIYTPQMVVDGRLEFVGSDTAAARRAIERSLSAMHGAVRITVDTMAADRVGVSVTASDLPAPARGDRADIIVAVTEDQLRSDVKRGENHGRVLTHAAVVRYMATIGEAGTSPAEANIPLAADWQRDHLKVVAFVQELHSRGVLGSASVSLQNARR
jgi:hypothetical protein